MMHEIIHLLTDTTKTMLPFSFKHFFGSLEQRSNQKEDSIPYTHKVYRHTWTTIVATMRRSQLTEFSYFSLYDVVYNGGHFSDNFKNVLLVQSQSLIFGFYYSQKAEKRWTRQRRHDDTLRWHCRSSFRFLLVETKQPLWHEWNCLGGRYLQPVTTLHDTQTRKNGWRWRRHEW